MVELIDHEELLENLSAGKKILAKDLSVAAGFSPGNPYCQIETDSMERKYCSKALFDSAETTFVIPQNSEMPRKHKACQACGNDSWVAEGEDGDPKCGRCDAPMFDCPACGKEVHGEVDSCPHDDCGRAYKW